MRSLIITIERPFPPISGAELRNWAQAQALAQLGPVTLAYLEPRAASLQPAAPLTLLPLAPEEKQPIWGDPRQRRTPLDLAFTPNRLAAVTAAIRQSEADLILLEGTALYPLISLARSRGARLIMDFHNVESALLKSQQEARRPTWLRPLLGTWHPSCDAIQEIEREVRDSVDQLWVCSPEDAARLPAGKAPYAVIPNVAPGPIAATARSAPAQHCALFFGHLGYPPNQTAARFILRQLAPRCPDVSFLIAGRAAHHLRKERLGGNVELVADPAEVAPLYAGASVALLPLTSGGGTRIKALEALAQGLPIIATALAIEGLGLVSEEHYLAAENVAAFQGALNRLIEDRALYQRLSAAGLTLVTERFSQTTLNRLVAEALA